MTNAVTRGAYESIQQEGDKAFQKGDIEAAASFYKQALEIDPSNSWAEYSLAEAYKCQGDIEGATYHYTNALKLEPFDNSSFIQLLFMKVEPEQLNPIATFYQQLSISKPNNPWANVRLGDILTKQRRVEEAIASYKVASYKLLKNRYPDYIRNCKVDSNFSEPAYIIIGPMKTATSALYEYINQHPRVLPSIKKEIHFFSDPHRFAYGKKWYLSHFPSIKPKSGYITGEASPGYIVNHVHHKVASLFPKVKIIALIRNPVDRAFSHYTHNCKHGFERRSFLEAVTAELKVLERIEDSVSLDRLARTWDWNRYPGYVLLGLYAHFLKQWYTAFPSEQILVISNTILSACPAQTMQQVFSFLNLTSHNEASYPKHNAGSYVLQDIDAGIKEQLTEFYEPYERKLESFLAGREKLFLS